LSVVAKLNTVECLFDAPNNDLGEAIAIYATKGFDPFLTNLRRDRYHGCKSAQQNGSVTSQYRLQEA
jgi:hypothetical protein